MKILSYMVFGFLILFIFSVIACLGDSDITETGEPGQTINVELESKSSPTAKKIIKNYDLGPGRYKIGKDIMAGTYDIKCVSGSGNVFTDENTSLVNLIMGIKDDGFHIPLYKNADLLSGVLNIENVNIKLIGVK